MNRIIVNPDICNGKPVIKGTRITVQTIFEFLQAGNTAEEILDEFPNLTVDDINACYEFAVKISSNNFYVESLEVQ